jgi:hypothetical protein
MAKQRIDKADISKEGYTKDELLLLQLFLENSAEEVYVEKISAPFMCIMKFSGTSKNNPGTDISFVHEGGLCNTHLKIGRGTAISIVDNKLVF